MKINSGAKIDLSGPKDLINEINKLKWSLIGRNK